MFKFPSSSPLQAALPRLSSVIRNLTSGPKVPATNTRPPRFETIFVAAAMGGGRLGSEILGERHQSNVIEITLVGNGVSLAVGTRLPWGPPHWDEGYRLWKAHGAERCALVPSDPAVSTWFTIEDEYVDAFARGLPWVNAEGRAAGLRRAQAAFRRAIREA